MDLSLFPNKEEWGTGDEAMDSKLSTALKLSLATLSYESISQFYFLGMSLKTRAYNPAFAVTIELVTKALFHFLNPDELIDHTMKKMRGEYFQKEKIHFSLPDLNTIKNELLTHKKYRYNHQIDFSLQVKDGKERNPYTRDELKRSTMDLSVKIIFKDFKSYLEGHTKAELFTDPLFIALRAPHHILLIENFAEVWYHQDQIFILSSFSR